MITRNIPVPLADLDALLAIRGVIADAAHHPGRAAAIEALDRLKAAWEAHRVEERADADRRCAAYYEKPGVLLVDDPEAASPAPSRDAVAHWYKAELPTSQTGQIRGHWESRPVPQRQVNHATFDTKREPAASGVLAEVAALFGYRTLEVGRDDLSRVWRISARTTESAMLTVEVAERDLAASPLPTTPWFDAFSKLAALLEVPDHASKLPALVEILACAIGVAPSDESEAEFRARLRLPPRPAPDKAMMLPRPGEPGCIYCGDALMFWARERGDGMCGKCFHARPSPSKPMPWIEFQALDSNGNWWWYRQFDHGEVCALEREAPPIGECTPHRRKGPHSS